MGIFFLNAKMTIRDIWFRLSANPRCVGSLARLMVRYSPTTKKVRHNRYASEFRLLVHIQFSVALEPNATAQDRRYLLERNYISPNGALLSHQQKVRPARYAAAFRFYGQRCDQAPNNAARGEVMYIK